MKALLFLFLLSPLTLFAEYRVYQYSVRTVIPKKDDQNSYTVISTLDPVSYRAYHGGSDSIQLNLVRTWMCMGNTGNGRPLCDSPEMQTESMTNL